MKKIYNILSFVFFYLFSFSNTFGAFGFEKVDNGLKGEETGDISFGIINLIIYLLGFIALIGVIWAIYAGFQILTAAGDDEKVKSGKKTLLFAILGIFIVIIAWALISGIFSSLEQSN